MKRHESIPFYIPWITKNDEKALLEALKSRWLTGGPIASQFEEVFAEYIGVGHAISVNSCTADLHLAMRVPDIKPGDEVIVPVFTFAATANAPIFCGAKPVFADIDERTFNISPNDILERITSKTKAIIPVHYGGQACDMKEILEIAKDHKLNVVEDCAHSLGADYKGEKTGEFGIMGCFSFYPTKIITTLEGGMITTNDEHIAKKLRILREHGMTRSAAQRESEAKWYYDVVDLGYNYRLNELQAALGLSQLKRVKEGIERRIRLAHYYTKKLSSQALHGVIPPYKAPDRTHIFHLYAVKIQEEITGVTRDELFKKLMEAGIGLSVHYTPLHLLSFYKSFLKAKSKGFPVAERVYRQILSLPLFPTLTKEKIDFITQRIQEILNES
ncbi:MAG: DegT/DnrJ/EryC1/StrS family aminotransferase [Candidatus Jordarchaeaceae archaeon]